MCVCVCVCVCVFSNTPKGINEMLVKFFLFIYVNIAKTVIQHGENYTN